ncbi:LysE family translocator [Vibrio sp. RC27]
MQLSTLLPAAFPALALAHFVALLSPGQDFFLLIAHAIRYKLKGSQFICLGIALGNAFYIAITIVGWSSLKDYPLLFSTVELLGAAYLLWIGSRLVKSQQDDSMFHTSHVAIPSAKKQLLLGLYSALLNPKNALFYMSLMAVILGNEVSVVQQASCGVWMFFAVLVWDLVIASIIGQSRVQNWLYSAIHIIEKGAGIILILFGLALFVDYLPH